MGIEPATPLLILWPIDLPPFLHLPSFPTWADQAKQAPFSPLNHSGLMPRRKISLMASLTTWFCSNCSLNIASTSTRNCNQPSGASSRTIVTNENHRARHMTSYMKTTELASALSSLCDHEPATRYEKKMTVAITGGGRGPSVGWEVEVGREVEVHECRQSQGAGQAAA